MSEVVLKTIEQNDNVSLYSICFELGGESEFEKFMQEFIEKNVITNIESATFII